MTRAQAPSRKPVGVTQQHGRHCPQREDGATSCRCPWSMYAKVSTPAGPRQFKKGGFPSQRAAKEARARIIEEHRTGQLTTLDRTTTVEEWLNRWWAERSDPEGERPLRPTTVYGYRRDLDRYWIPLLGRLRLADLRAEHIERAMRTIRREHPHLSPSSRRGVYAVLRSAMTKAVQKKLIAASPCVAVDSDVLPTVRRAEVKPWQPHELAQFLDSDLVAGHRLAPLFEVAALSGLRRGELAGLRWADLDLDRGVATIRQQRVMVGTQVVTGDPKSNAGVRTVDLADETVTVLRGVRARTATERLAWGEAWTDSGLVFVHEDGRGLVPEQITKTFLRLCRQVGVRRVRLHDLRHGSASLQLAAGVPLAVVSKRLGHSSVGITGSVYSHMIGTVGRDAAEASAALVPRRTREA